MSLAYSTTDAIVDIHDCTDSATAIKSYRRYISQFYVDNFISGEIDLGNRKRTVLHAVVWQDQWRKRYFRSGFQQHDPIFEALDSMPRAFTWAELRQSAELSNAGADALVEAAKDGWVDGLVVRRPRVGTHYGLVSLVTHDHVLEPRQKADLTAVSLVFHDQMRLLVPREGFRMPPAGLTPREIECVRLAARGHSDIEAGEMLGIRGSTVHEYIDRAKRKLDAGNRAELAALAKSFGIIPL